MILILQIFDVTANENAHYKRNELECLFKPRRWDTSFSHQSLLITVFTPFCMEIMQPGLPSSGVHN